MSRDSPQHRVLLQRLHAQSGNTVSRNQPPQFQINSGAVLNEIEGVGSNLAVQRSLQRQWNLSCLIQPRIWHWLAEPLLKIALQIRVFYYIHETELL
jgi:hypothetical protein